MVIKPRGLIWIGAVDPMPNETLHLNNHTFNYLEAGILS